MLPDREAWDGDQYQARFDVLADPGLDVHGKAVFVMTLGPETVLDAGCGTGRVARELATRGVDVVGVDAEPLMIDAARRRNPGITWQVADVTDLSLDREFDVVVMAGG